MAIKESIFWYDECTDEVKEAWTTERFMQNSQVLWSRDLADLQVDIQDLKNVRYFQENDIPFAYGCDGMAHALENISMSLYGDAGHEEALILLEQQEG